MWLRLLILGAFIISLWCCSESMFSDPETVRITGVVSSGFALEATEVIVLSQSDQELARSVTDSMGYYALTMNIHELPAKITVQSDTTKLRAIVPILPISTVQRVIHVNPITDMIYRSIESQWTQETWNSTQLDSISTLHVQNLISSFIAQSIFTSSPDFVAARSSEYNGFPTLSELILIGLRSMAIQDTQALDVWVNQKRLQEARLLDSNTQFQAELALLIEELNPILELDSSTWEFKVDSIRTQYNTLAPQQMSACLQGNQADIASHAKAIIRLQAKCQDDPAHRDQYELQVDSINHETELLINRVCPNP